MKTEDTKALAQSALDTLAAQLEAGQSTALTTYLAAMARFHRYRINNVFLSFVGGEKGIAILVPIAYRRHDIDADRKLERSDRDTVRTTVGF